MSSGSVVQYPEATHRLWEMGLVTMKRFSGESPDGKARPAGVDGVRGKHGCVRACMDCKSHRPCN